MGCPECVFPAFCSLSLPRVPSPSASPSPRAANDEPADADPFRLAPGLLRRGNTGGDEHLPIQEAIVTCCLDHPIAGMTAPTCLDTQADLRDPRAHGASMPRFLSADIDAACTTYITEKHK